MGTRKLVWEQTFFVWEQTIFWGGTDIMSVPKGVKKKINVLGTAKYCGNRAHF